MDTVELGVLRRQTTHFIADNPESVILKRSGERTPDGAGGYTVSGGVPLASQSMRLIIQGGNVASRNVDGEEIKPAYVVIALWDADIRKGDVFVKFSRNYEVMFVREDRRYETWAEVVYRG